MTIEVRSVLLFLAGYAVFMKAQAPEPVNAVIGVGLMVVAATSLLLRIVLKKRISQEYEAGQDFLAASIATWRHIDQHSCHPEDTEARAQMTRLNIRQRDAWHKYREFLHEPEETKATETHRLP